MSFADKIGSLMARPNDDLVAKDDVPWWMKYGGRGLGIVGGGIAIFLGVWNCVGILVGNVDCLLSGLWQMVAGFGLIIIEAPCCCMFIDYVQTISDKVEKRPYWNRGAAYCIVALPPILICFSLSSIFGSGLIFLTGVVYGMMGLGKKASADEMRNNAANETSTSSTITSGNNSNNINSGYKSSLINNAEPVFTGNIPYDSNV